MLGVSVFDLFAEDLHVPVPGGGRLMTASALGLAIGGRILTALTIKIVRRTVLRGSLAAFMLLTAAPVMIPTSACSSSFGWPPGPCRRVHRRGVPHRAVG